MELIPRTISTLEEYELFCAQLKSAELPFHDLNVVDSSIMVGYYKGNELVGTGALEVYGDFALLRSLSVKFGLRGQSMGSMITENLLTLASENGLKGVYLLTETAHGFFLKKGFIDVARETVPPEVRTSSEFSQVCPATAVCMYAEIPKVAQL